MSKQGKNTIKSENHLKQNQSGTFCGWTLCCHVSIRLILKLKQTEELFSSRGWPCLCRLCRASLQWKWILFRLISDSAWIFNKILDLFLPDSFLLKQRCFCRVFGVCVCISPGLPFIYYPFCWFLGKKSAWTQTFDSTIQLKNVEHKWLVAYLFQKPGNLLAACTNNQSTFSKAKHTLVLPGTPVTDLTITFCSW